MSEVINDAALKYNSDVRLHHEHVIETKNSAEMSAAVRLALFTHCNKKSLLTKKSDCFANVTPPFSFSVIA